MENFRMTRLFLLPLMLLVWLISPSDAGAVEINGVGLGPSIVDRTVKPGESFEQVFVVRNKTAAAVDLQSYLQDYRVENNQWNKVENPDAVWSPMTWATIISAPEKLDPGQKGDIRVRFDVPENAEMGEHVTYFSAKFTPAAARQEEEQSTQITVASEIRSIVYVKVTDPLGIFNLARSWRIVKAGTGYWHFDQPTFTVAAANTGNVHLEVCGTIEITDLIRNQKTQLTVPLFNILPDTEKKMEINWKEAPFIGYFKGQVELTYDGVNFEKRDFSFVVVPLLTLAGTAAVIIAIILAVVLYIRKLQKRLAEIEKLQNNNFPD